MIHLPALLTVSRLTWIEARRRRIVLAGLACGILLVIVFTVAAYSISGRHQPVGVQRLIQLQSLTLAGLYVVNFLVVALAVLLPVDTLSGEISSGVMQTLAAKPIRRAEILLGKGLMYWLMIAAYIAILVGGIVLSMRVTTGFVQRQVVPACALMQLEATVLLSVTLAGGVYLTTIANGILGFSFFALGFVGGWIELIGGMAGSATARYIGTAISLVSPSDVMWRLAMHLLQPPMMSQVLINPFSPGSVPSAAMVWWSAGFAAVILGVAVRGFQARAL
jgi:Cu-processing system permease protein